MSVFQWTEDIPFDLGNRSAESAVFSVDSDAFDVSIGSIPLLYHITPERPYERVGAQWRKEQFDNLSHVGEQSLTGWWLRSQVAFNGGLGVTYFEPLHARDESVETRFRDSRGVDVLREDGEVHLLPETEQLLATASSNVDLKASDTRLLTLDGTILRAFDGGELGDQADFRSATQAISGGSAIYECDKPAGVERTDILLAFQSKQSSAVPTVPEGGETWQLLGEVHSSFVRTFVWWKIAGDSEPTEYTFFNTGDGGSDLHGRVSIIAIKDAAQVQPTITTVNGSGSGTTINTPAPAVEPPRGGVEVRLAAYHDSQVNPAPWTSPANYDERTDVAAVSGSGLTHTTATRQLLTGFDTGIQAFTTNDAHTTLGRHGVTVNVLNSEVSTGVVSVPGGSVPTRLAYTGAKFLIGHATGIAELDAHTGIASSALWTNAADPVDPYWLKQRIFAASGRAVYELTLAGGDMSGETPLYEHPDPNWQWDSMTETGAAVWMAGHSGDKSAIHVVTIESDGSTPTLAGATVAVQLPDGEIANEIMGYLDFVLVATNRGLRVAFAQGSNLALGPLIFTEPAYSLTARGDYVWAGLDQGLTRKVDLGRPISGELIFAYANDLESTGPGRVTAFAWFRGDMAFGHAATGVMTKGPNLRQQGYLTTGYIRVGVLEPKYFESVRVSGAVSSGASIELLTSVNQEATHVSSLANFVGSRDIALKLPGKVDRLSLTFRLNRGSGDSPVLQGYQLRALPAPARRQRLIRLPLMAYDRENDRWNNTRGGPGFAWARIRALEALEDKGSPVPFRDFRTGEARICIVEQVLFQGEKSPSREKQNNGGVLAVTVRTVD